MSETKKKRTGLWVALAAALLLAIGGIIYWKRKKDAEAPITTGTGSDGSPDTGINPMGGGGSSYTPPPNQSPVQNGGNTGSQSTNTGGVIAGSDGGPDTNINPPAPTPAPPTGNSGGGLGVYTPPPASPPVIYTGGNATQGVAHF